MGVVIRNCDALGRWLFRLDDDTGCRTDGPYDTATGGRGSPLGARPKHRGAASCERQNFVPDKMKTNSSRPRLVKEKRCRGVDHVAAHLVPRISLSENILREAFGAIAAVGLLNSLKY
jgi:hypothetical protein